MKILIFGDIVSGIGRRAVKTVLPAWKAAHEPDLVIANAENLAHGKGVTADTLNELLAAGIDFFTSGNHIWDKKEVHEVFSDPRLSEVLIRPANWPGKVPGQGSKFLTIGTKNVLVVNLIGRVYSKVLSDDPFRTFDDILAENALHFSGRGAGIVLVDFHGDATSERNAFGWHAAGRASAVWGTHTHVPTRDARVLPGGTAFVTDVGMSGFRDGVIGVAKESVIANFLSQLPPRHEVPESGEAVVNAIVVTVDASGRATDIASLQEIVQVS